jgi:hypothetical protein
LLSISLTQGLQYLGLVQIGQLDQIIYNEEKAATTHEIIIWWWNDGDDNRWWYSLSNHS